MIYVTYDAISGALVGVSGDIPQPNSLHGTRVVDAVSVDLSNWNPITLQFSEEVAGDGVRSISGVQFLRRFTQTQRIAIRGLAASVPEVDDFMRLLDATIAQDGEVNLNDPDTVAGVTALAVLLPERGIDPSVVLA